MRYFYNKVLYGLVTLFGVITVIFFLFNILPGDPAQMILGQREDSEQLRLIRQKYGFDKSLATQYLYYLNDLSPLSLHKKDPDHYTFLNADTYSYIKIADFKGATLALKFPYLRKSFQKNDKKVIHIIGDTLPNTIILAVAAISIAAMLGIFLGVLSALYKDTWFDRTTVVISTMGMSVPSFLSAIIFSWLFGFVLHRYTHLNMTGSLYVVDDYGEGRHLALKNLILPAIVLGIRPLAVVVQLTRSSLLEILGKDFIRTAKAKGLNTVKIIWRHALRNALNPVITATSGWFASLLTGAVFVEYIFGWNGLGRELVNALNTLDFPVIMGAVIVISSMFVFINSMVDIIYGWLDPRIRLR